MNEKNTKKNESVLMTENVRLYKENLKLMAKIEKLTSSSKNTEVKKTTTTQKASKNSESTKAANTNKTTTPKTQANKTTASKQEPKSTNTKKSNENVQAKQNLKTKAADIEKSMKNNDKKNLSKFQAERENKKEIVAKNKKKNVSIQEIAKMIGQSEPTVRNYIRELRLEGRLA